MSPRLLVDGRDHRTGVRVEAVERVVVADGGDRAANQRLEIHISLSRDFAGDDHQAGCGQGFAGHAAERIFGQAGVENGVRNLVGDLIGMAFGYRFGRKKIGVTGCQLASPSAIWTLRPGGRVRTQQPINEHFADFNKLTEKAVGSNDFGPAGGYGQPPGSTGTWR